MILDAQSKMVIKFQTAVHILLHQTTRIFHKDNHHQTGYFGTSAVVCTPITYAANSASYMLIQRPSHRCSYAKLPVTIPPRHVSEELLVAVPINSNFSL